ncbi:class B sortase [Carnobacterium funditum]|uniref:class B sortase n=1 Tax=Carnobacterium funditum TaxID=2752 RepID=UPI00068F7505|nr:class B sortase [Carnobacterium funditum]
MKKKYWLAILSSLLLVQIVYYYNTVTAQRKDVKVPESALIQTTAKDNEVPKEATSTTKTDTEKNAEEEIIFEKNAATEYYDLNSDYVGWLNIEDTAVDYPVVRGKDNEFYLKHNFYKEEDVLGAIFMDYRNAGMGLDKHTILYGHYAKYGQMFKDLDRYLSEDFLTNHSEFVFTDSFTKRTYKIFSVHPSDANPKFLDVSFEENEFPDFVETLKNESIFSSDTPVSPEDNILTLVTCNYDVKDGRLFIHAVEITE